jgi:glycine/D-amino acid oxidase-like deaminating enzyme
MRLIEQTSWDGVAVIGGGVAGVLTAQKIAERGIPALIVEARRLGGGQTAHAHGWLHRGNVFADIDRNEADQLRAGAEWWQRRLTETGASRISEEATIAFADPAAADEIVSTWRHVGLTPRAAAPLSERLPRTYRTEEWSVSPVEALRAVVQPELPVAYVRASAISLRADGPTREANLVLDRRGHQSLLKARAVVIAAGTGSARLLNKTTSQPAIQLRRSHMVVIRSTAELPAAIALPEQAAKGLFGVQRQSDAGTHWLFSNFLSYGGQDTPTARNAWRRSLLRTLRAYLPELVDDDGALWGSYPAVKSELRRRVPLGVPGQGVISTTASNAVAVVPGKFTAAPIIAEAAAETAIARMSARAVGTPIQLDNPPHWAEEDWALTPLSTLATFERAAS